jgi:peroxiredoxin
VGEKLEPGDPAPQFAALAAHGDQITEVTLDSLLAGNRGLVLTTYLLDFTGG